LSHLAEFARTLHENHSHAYDRELVPARCAARGESLHDIRAVIFDVYGTLVNYWRPGLHEIEERPHFLQEACREVADRFSFTEYLIEMDPEAAPEKTLYDLYCGLLALSHEKAAKKGALHHEVKIEAIWNLIVLMLKRRGYDPEVTGISIEEDFGRYIGFAYNFFSLGRGLYPGVVGALEKLKQNGMTLGIVSNAQFYTPIDLTLFIRDQTGGRIDDANELFDPDLCFYSYEYNTAKPDLLLFQKLYDALYEYQILPSQTVYVGNDLLIDIAPAQKAGMKTAFFSGDAQSSYLHGKENEIIPDITFTAWEELPHKLSFYAQGTRSI
jgi:putative hydrolase of the HAD superfamily